MLQQIAPYFGYLASLCLVISLIVTNDLKFRWYNTFGTIFFIVYAVILSAFPVLLTNGILFLINVFYLFKIYNRKESFDHAEFGANEALPQKHLDYHSKDIAAYFSGFDKSVLQKNLNLIITRDLTVANIFSANISTEGDAFVDLNYTIPKYRDYKIGSYIFETGKDFLLSKGIRRIVYREVNHPGHLDFLKVCGFSTAEVNGKSCYVKSLA
ncbi:MAG: hypothetical protein QM687_09585 [Ferruginibacter sp.]